MPTLQYKGRPLVRSGNELYYGNPTDPYIIMLGVQESTPVDDALSISGRVTVTLLSTDQSQSLKSRVMRTSEKNGLYNALDIGAIWLERALSGK